MRKSLSVRQVTERKVDPDVRCVCIALAHNEAMRLEDFLRHYRNLGVRLFLILDDHSDDGTSEILERQDDVIVFKPDGTNYREHKRQWRLDIANNFADGKWVIFPDIDELFVYPYCEDRPVDVLLQYLDQERYEAVFAPMVEMYNDRPLNSTGYRPGAPLLEHFPLFDGDGYRMVPPPKSFLRKYPTPPVHMHGGPRERCFYKPENVRPSWLQRAILKYLLNIRQPFPPGPVQQKLSRWGARLVRPLFPEEPAAQCKLTLIKWHNGITFSAAPHSAWPALRLADLWGALLHFKFVDLPSEARYNVRRSMHVAGAAYYHKIISHENKLSDNIKCQHTRQYNSALDLLEVGLLRSSKGWDHFKCD